ncbi:mechanosensitive ion channel family protein [Labrenzia suaedae]|uniref:Small-conductance mechanosensitive channel n=1 Tax=Roseibium litorale TaxID=2803841 RepID=A0ABR9CTP1_9HYPH|nr:mechanosensitive ion channel family protein [Roseibium litorale]
MQPLSILTSQLTGLIASLIALTPNLIAAVLLILLIWAASHFFGRLMKLVFRRSHMRPSLTVALTKLIRIGIWTFGLLIAATLIFPNLTPTKLLTGLGIGSIAVGLAFKDIFENFLAGFLILIRKPMRIGDDIECESISGQVEAINIRDTFIRKRSGELVLVPNSFLYKNPLKVLTDRHLRRISLVVGVAYGEDVDRAREVISNAVEDLKTRDKSKAPDVFAREFNSSSIDFLVRWWTNSTPSSEHRSRDEAVSAIKIALDSAGIEIPFPYRTLTFKEPLPVWDMAAGEDGEERKQDQKTASSSDE